VRDEKDRHPTTDHGYSQLLRNKAGADGRRRISKFSALASVAAVFICVAVRRRTAVGYKVTETIETRVAARTTRTAIGKGTAFRGKEQT